MNFKKGFTLAELVIVAGIIAILTSIVLANLSSARIKGRDARRAADLKQLQQAVENYFENNSAYPVGSGAATLNVLTVAPNNILPSIPKDPLGASYCYNGVASPPSYCIATYFEGPIPVSLPPTSACTVTCVGSGNLYKVSNQ